MILFVAMPTRGRCAVAFVLDHRLEESSFFVADWPLCRLCLKNDKTFPWLYLVPRRENVREIYDLSPQDQQQLVSEISKAAAAINALYTPDKINTAALGNMVPQLHVHIFGRYTHDAAWPKPVWAVDIPETAYTDAEKNVEIQKIKTYFESVEQEGKKAVCQP